MEKDFVQDTSVVLRWEPINGAEWYVVHVDPPSDNIVQVVDENMPETRKITNLTPGTHYRFTVQAKNSPFKDTVSLPTTVEQFTSMCNFLYTLYIELSIVNEITKLSGILSLMSK